MPFPFRKLKAERERLGMSRTELASAAGVPFRTLESLEQGRRINPTHDTVEGLCKALGVDCTFFFGDDLPEEDAPKPGPGRPKKT